MATRVQRPSEYESQEQYDTEFKRVIDHNYGSSSLNPGNRIWRRRFTPNRYNGIQEQVGRDLEDQEEAVGATATEHDEQQGIATLEDRPIDTEEVEDTDTEDYGDEDEDDDEYDPRSDLKKQTEDEDSKRRRRKRKRKKDRDKKKKKDDEDEDKKDDGKKKTKTSTKILRTGIAVVGVGVFLTATFGSYIAEQFAKGAIEKVWKDAGQLSEPAMDAMLTSQFMDLYTGGHLKDSPKMQKSLKQAGFGEIVVDPATKSITGMTAKNLSGQTVPLTKELLDTTPDLKKGIISTQHLSTNNPAFHTGFIKKLGIDRSKPFGDSKDPEEINKKFDQEAYERSRSGVDVPGDIQDEANEQRDEILNGERDPPGPRGSWISRLNLLDPEGAGRAIANGGGKSGSVTRAAEAVCNATEIVDAGVNIIRTEPHTRNGRLAFMWNSLIEGPLVDNSANKVAMQMFLLSLIKPNGDGQTIGNSAIKNDLFEETYHYDELEGYAAGLQNFTGLETALNVSRAFADTPLCQTLNAEVFGVDVGEIVVTILDIGELIGNIATLGASKLVGVAAGVATGIAIQFVIELIRPDIINLLIGEVPKNNSKALGDFWDSGMRLARGDADKVIGLPRLRESQIPAFAAAADEYQNNIAAANSKSIWDIHNEQSITHRIAFAVAPLALSMAGNQGFSSVASFAIAPNIVLGSQFESLVNGRASAARTAEKIVESGDHCTDPEFSDLGRDVYCSGLYGMSEELTAVPFDEARQYMLDNEHITTSDEPTDLSNVDVGGLSGLDWPSGVHAGNDVPTNASFGTWRGRPIDVMMIFTDRNSWGGLINPFSIEGDRAFYDVPGKIYVISQPTFPKGGNNAACASGQYNSQWEQFGQTLQSHGLDKPETVVRIGWEFNGDFMYWHTDANPANFKQCWRNVATSIKMHAPNIRADWTLNAHGGPVPAGGDMYTAYPGDDVVDIVGMDSYDMWPPSPTEAAFDDQCNRGGGFGLCDLVKFTVQHDKQLGIGEWGVAGACSGASRSGQGGGDNPVYIQKMHEFFKTYAKIIAYEAYYDDPEPGNICSSLMRGNGDGSSNPQAAAAYKELFGTGGPGSGPITGGGGTGGGGANTITYEYEPLNDKPSSDEYKDWLADCTDILVPTTNDMTKCSEGYDHMYDMFMRYTVGLNINKALIQKLTGATQKAARRTNCAIAGCLSRDGTQLLLNGQPYKFAGFNADQFAGCALPGAPYPGPGNDYAQRYFSELMPQSMTRVWMMPGFSFDAMDAVVEAAEENGQFLAVTLFEGLPDCGQSVHIAGPPTAQQLDWINQVVSRYSDSAAIGFWEIANEAGGDYAARKTWYDGVAAAIKAIDTNHLVGTGNHAPYNNDTTGYQSVHDGPDIDLISMHEYDPGTGISPHAGKAQAVAEALDKPFYIGEDGFCCGGGSTGSFEGNAEKLKEEWTAYLTDPSIPACVGMLYWDFKLNQPEVTTANFDNALWTNAAMTYEMPDF